MMPVKILNIHANLRLTSHHNNNEMTQQFVDKIDQIFQSVILPTFQALSVLMTLHYRSILRSD